MNGTLLDGRYRLEAELRRDSDLVVYAALDERLQRRVAVKLLQPERADDAAYLEAYAAGVSRAATLNHPHVVPVFDSSFNSPQPFVVEALVEGRSLASRLAAGDRPGTADVLRIAEQSAGALAAAHAAGIAHGGLSPEVIWIEPSGDVRITDFSRPQPTAPDLEAIRYQAPELSLGGTADARSDVYALGAVLYHLIDGQPPFDGPDRAAINLAKISTTPRPLDPIAPELPPGLLRAIEHALRPNPAERPGNGTAFREQVGQLSTTHAALDPTVQLAATQVLPQLSVPPQRVVAPVVQPLDEEEPLESSSGMLPWIGLVVVLALVGILFFALRNPNAEPPVAATPVPSVLGQSEQQALLILQQAGLNGVVLQRANSDTVPGGQVAEQDPAAGGEPPADKTVKLTISLGPRFVTVPNVKGLSEAEAKKLLPKYGLYASLASAHEPDQPDGVVTAQFPSPGQKVDKGGRVTLYINRLPDEAPPPAEEPREEEPQPEPPAEPAEEPPAEQPAEEPPAEGGPVDRVIDSAVEAAKEKAAEELKAQTGKVKERARERIKEEREKLKDRAKEVLTPDRKGP